LAECIKWEREAGPYRTPIERVTVCRRLARKYDLPYAAVELAFPWFADDGEVA
jgi:hypothetical protein